MKKRTFSSLEDIDLALHTARLKREIALEELKYLKHHIGEELHPSHWTSYLLRAIKKYGIYYLLRKWMR